ncbi:MAG: hypothetical protein ACYC5K_01065 [Saccharofermentanales bacterium]
MSYHLYLTLIPEALIASMLNPEEFASYYAVGERGKSHGQVLFIEIDPAFRHEFFQIDKGVARCVPTAEGLPKKSVYIAIYRVLEHIPVSAMRELYYVTRDGRALKTEKIPALNNESGLHFYSELAPVRPAVVSPLGPMDFTDLLMGRHEGFQGLPAIAFIELRLGELATDPDGGAIHDLPYENIEHLRRCLKEVKTKPVSSKMFDLSGSGILSFRVVKNGVFIGNHTDGLFLYPMPSTEELRVHHHDWWRSANT